MKNIFQLDGQVAIITGGSGVLGGAMAEALSAAGVRVAILGRTAGKVDKQVAAIQNNGGEAMTLVADVLNRDQLEAARQQVMDTWGRIDILVNAAGGNLSGATVQPHQTIYDLSWPDFEQVNALNLHGTVLPTIIFSQPMTEAGKGSIINISSVSAVTAITRVIGYSLAKGAIDNFTRWMAVEMANKYGEGIRVNAIMPGFFLTEQNRFLLTNPDGSFTDRANTILRNTPMKRFGRPEELNGALIWLCSDAASFVTGAVIAIDGGFTAFSGV